MKHFPATFPTENSYRHVVFLPQMQACDFDRLEVLAADAISAARDALEGLNGLPHDVLREIATWHRRLSAVIDRRKVLDDTFRHCSTTILNRLARIELCERDAETLGVAVRKLREALTLSYRVSDLLAAEREIGQLRGHAI